MRIEKQQQRHKANEEEEMSRECVSAWFFYRRSQSASEPANPTACIENETVTYAKRKFQFIAVFLRMTWTDSWNLICLDIFVSNVYDEEIIKKTREKENEILQLLLIYSLLNCRFHVCVSFSHSLGVSSNVLPCPFHNAYTRFCFQNM